mgnify:CR=1 FL=1
MLSWLWGPGDKKNDKKDRYYDNDPDNEPDKDSYDLYFDNHNQYHPRSPINMNVNEYNSCSASNQEDTLFQICL